MIILIDIGNSRIKIGTCKQPDLKNDIEVFFCKNLNNLKPTIDKIVSGNKVTIDGVLISSVVPELNDEVKSIVKGTLKTEPTFLSTELKTGIKFNYSPITDLGHDRIADSVAAHNNYPQGKYKIVVDFGTATVFEVISDDGVFLGGSIFPGLEIASKALASKASLIDDINFDDWDGKQKVIGSSTNEALRSSIYWGYIALTEGIIKKIIEELNLSKNEYLVIGTGGFAEIINNQISIFDKIDQNLTLDGMRIIYNLNKK